METEYPDYETFIYNVCNGKINFLNNNISSLTYALYYCKSEKKYLLDILLILYDTIINNIHNLINNKIINNYINFIFSQWNIEIDINQLFTKGDPINYLKYIENCNEFNNLNNNIIQLNKYIKLKGNELDGQIKDNIFLLNENINNLINTIKDYKDKLKSYQSNCQINYNILLDISSKNKSEYIQYIKGNNESNVFNSLIINNTNIPEDINVIFINYIMINNMIKKEINYILNMSNKNINKLEEYSSDLKEVIQTIEIIN